MTSAQLDIACARHGTDRYRWLVSDDNPDVASRDAYRDLVSRVASDDYDSTRPAVVYVAMPTSQPPKGEAEAEAAPIAPAPSPARVVADLGRVKACPHRDPRTDCGCAGLAKCGAGRGSAEAGKLANLQDCLKCVESGFIAQTD